MCILTFNRYYQLWYNGEYLVATVHQHVVYPLTRKELVRKLCLP